MYLIKTLMCDESNWAVVLYDREALFLGCIKWFPRSVWGYEWRPSGNEWTKAIEQYIHVILFIMLCKVVLTGKSVDETLVCGNSNESYWAALSYGTVYYAVQGGPNL